MREVWEQMDPDALLPQKGNPYYKTLARPPFKVRRALAFCVGGDLPMVRVVTHTGRTL